ncbi:MAG: SGNH/GDSL hydrolase family protein [Kofleriaceae bacterium]|nr:SGNH/GDSL hydrolase family protein [Kofleriaceae bacterium]
MSVAIAFSIAEMAERWIGSTPSAEVIAKGRYRLTGNASLGYEPIPDMTATSSSDSFMDYVEASNSLGFRDYEHAERNPGVYRVLILGDSVTSGHHIKNYKDAFPAQLEKILKKKGREVEVLNFGVNGYNTQQEVEILKDRGLKFSPDLVVVAYCLNDRVRSDGGLLAMLLNLGDGKGPRRTGLGGLLSESHLARLLEFRYRSVRSVRSEYGALFKDTVAMHFEELSKLSSDHGFAVLIAILPDFRDLDSASHRGDYSAVKKLADKASLPSIQLLPIAQECKDDGDPPLFVDHYHPSAAGHACIAHGLSAVVEVAME